MASLAEKLREMDKVLTVAEVAALFRVSDDCLRELVQKNQIPHFMVGKRARFDSHILANWVERRMIKVQGAKGATKVFLTEQ